MESQRLKAADASTPILYFRLASLPQRFLLHVFNFSSKRTLNYHFTVILQIFDFLSAFGRSIANAINPFHGQKDFFEIKIEHFGFNEDGIQMSGLKISFEVNSIRSWWRSMLKKFVGREAPELRERGHCVRLPGFEALPIFSTKSEDEISKSNSKNIRCKVVVKLCDKVHLSSLVVLL